MTPRPNAAAADNGPLAMVCCGGSIPFAVADTVQRQGRRVVLFACRGWADPIEVARYPHHWVAIAQLGRFSRLARQEGCHDVVFIGTLVRPSLGQLRLDWGTVRALPSIIRAYRGGDDHLLSGVARIFEGLGFHVVGAHEVAPEILMREGPLTTLKPAAGDESDIRRALALLTAIGPFDVGQAVVVAKGTCSQSRQRKVRTRCSSALRSCGRKGASTCHQGSACWSRRRNRNRISASTCRRSDHQRLNWWRARASRAWPSSPGPPLLRSQKKSRGAPTPQKSSWLRSLNHRPSRECKVVSAKS